MKVFTQACMGGMQKERASKQALIIQACTGRLQKGRASKQALTPASILWWACLRPPSAGDFLRALVAKDASSGVRPRAAPAESSRRPSRLFRAFLLKLRMTALSEVTITSYAEVSSACHAVPSHWSGVQLLFAFLGIRAIADLLHISRMRKAQ